MCTFYIVEPHRAAAFLFYFPACTGPKAENQPAQVDRRVAQRRSPCEKGGSPSTLAVLSRVCSHKPRHECPAWCLHPPRSPKTKRLALTASSFHRMPPALKKGRVSPPPCQLLFRCPAPPPFKLLLAGALLRELLCFGRTPRSAAPWTRGASGERSRGGGGGQQLWAWRNNSCDRRIVMIFHLADRHLVPILQYERISPVGPAEQFNKNS